MPVQTTYLNLRIVSDRPRCYDDLVFSVPIEEGTLADWQQFDNTVKNRPKLRDPVTLSHVFRFSFCSIRRRTQSG